MQPNYTTQLENIFNYSVDPRLNKAYKTCLILTDRGQDLAKHVSSLIGEISPALRSKLLEAEAGFKNDTLNEAQMTVEFKTPEPVLINIILLSYDTSLIESRSLFAFLESLRELGGHVHHSLNKNELRNVNFFMSGLSPTTERYLMAFLEGFLLAMYSFTHYKTQDKGPLRFQNQVPRLKGGATKKRKPMHPRFVRHNPNNYAMHFIYGEKALTKTISTLVTIMKSVYLSRDMINTPGNIMTPVAMQQYVRTLVKEYKVPVTIEVFNTAACKKKGLNLLVAVGSGSDASRQSGLVILKYNGGGPKYCIVGKGITQDTGGYSLKPVQDIPSMKSDKSGAVIALSTILCCARLGLKVDLVAMMPLAQNSIGPSAVVPGDIITAYNGMTVEITDPDAEGRLILADALAYAVDHFPEHQLIDIATLTGEQEAMSCKKFSTLIEVNSGDCAEALVRSGELTGERFVKMPYLGEFIDSIESDVADVRNSPKECGGDMYPAAMFLSSFLKPDSKWIHIDLGGNTYDMEREYLEEGELASGVGIRVLVDFLTEVQKTP